jgi:DeoR/GlpR family transcriptional regulator of sugar metabolism
MRRAGRESAQLARELGVSEMTVRRDIAALEVGGFLRRTYGGATAHLMRSLDLTFDSRVLENAAAKRLIGMTAARLVGDARTLFVGTGSTTEQFARFLPLRDDVVIVTESLPIASLLGTRPGGVVVLGGLVRREELSCIGPAAIETISRYRADVAVLGASGVSARHGITELFDEESQNHRLMIERSERVVVVADATKLGGHTMAEVAPVSAVSLLITSEGGPEDELADLRAAGVEIIVARRASRDDRRDGGAAAAPEEER